MSPKLVLILLAFAAQQHVTHQTAVGDFNGDGSRDTAFLIPTPADTTPLYITDGPGPWRFYCIFSNPTLDTIPVHYTYDLHTASDVNNDGCDELMLVQPVAGYYRVMSFNGQTRRWIQLLQISSPRQHDQPRSWIYARSDTLFYLANRSRPDLAVSDEWEWTIL